ncbi:MAG: DUF72 domain-containing protein [Spirochaetia bacterium]|jgi:uncharacterized protein YecE (DUF72 family)|nr:DUF72 domain-containing protein [Spirochaetia bacterium]
MGDILIATSGYSYDDWRGILYPQELPKGEFLRYYSLFFPFVELNFSYYAMPKASNLAAMAARTPASFLFSIKAHRSLTHEIGSGWRQDSAAFSRAVGSLADTGRLAAVLVQLPYRFHYTPENREYLASLLSELSPLPVVVEFRNDEWRGESVYDELDRRGVGMVMVDRPELPGLPPMEERVTGGLAYMRFHGRNGEAWWSGDATTRYDYLYSRDELSASVPRLKRMAKAGNLLIAFNNHARGNAVSNAGELKALLYP